MKVLLLSADGGIVGENNFKWAKTTGLQLTRGSFKEGAVPLAISHDLYVEELEKRQFPAFCEIDLAVKNAKGANGKPIGAATIDEISYLKPVELTDILGLLQTREEFVKQSGAYRPEAVEPVKVDTPVEPAKVDASQTPVEPVKDSSVGGSFFGGRK
jgi:hypothetical protein